MYKHAVKVAIKTGDGVHDVGITLREIKSVSERDVNSDAKQEKHVVFF